ncbi:MAG: antitoxin component YwqK of YwqJK toxin-antitoxin module [Myxococcota bacterium]|jgi:antitoxin component YwqK of YwqJK toxin-antitoxin module
MRGPRISLSPLVLALLGFAACGTNNEAMTTQGGPSMAALGSEKTEKGTMEKFDLSGDGKADLWKVYETVTGSDGKTGRKLVRKEMDLNFDGKLDIRQFLNADGAIYREEMDLDFDGHIDAVAHYEDGKLARRELDLSFDGKPDIFKYYEGGKLIRKERVTSNTGKVNVWEYYEGGRLVRVGRDKDGDGKPEVFDDAPEPEPEMPGGAPGG